MLDLDTRRDLGLEDWCLTCLPLPISSWVPAHSNKPYFTNLPLEIRTNILERLLVSGGGLQPIHADNITKRVRLVNNQALGIHHSPWSRNSNRLTRPNPTLEAHSNFVALSSTCPQLHDECCAIFFGKNRFSFHNIKGMYIFLQHTTEKQRFSIKEVLFVADEPEYADWAFDLLAQCSLRKLTIGLRETFRIQKCLGDTKKLLQEPQIISLRRTTGWQNLHLKVVGVKHWEPFELEWVPAELHGPSSSKLQQRSYQSVKELEAALTKTLCVTGERRQTRNAKKRLEESLLSRNIEYQKRFLGWDVLDWNSCKKCKQGWGDWWK